MAPFYVQGVQGGLATVFLHTFTGARGRRGILLPVLLFCEDFGWTMRRRFGSVIFHIGAGAEWLVLFWHDWWFPMAIDSLLTGFGGDWLYWKLGGSPSSGFSNGSGGGILFGH